MHKRPIIIIPGIQGTKLNSINNKDFKTVWSGIKKYFSNIHVLKLQFNGVSDKGSENIIERADVENIAYSEIINYLRSLDYNVFIFGYDWRKSNIESAKELSKYVKNIQTKLKEPKINFLTHSMGGLVLSAYLKKLSPVELDKTVSKAIFTVPPFLGSIEASFNLTVGKSRLFNSSDDFRKVGRTFPGLYEILPFYKNAYEFEDLISEQNFDVYDFSTYWQQVVNVTSDKTRSKHNLISTRLEKVKEVRDQDDLVFNLSNCSDNLKKRMLVMVGGGEKTKDKIFVKKRKDDLKNYFDYEKFQDSKDGDGTVPIQSSTVFKNSITTLKLDTSWLEKRADSRLFMADWHAFFLNNGRVQNVIKRFFQPNTNLNGNWFESRGGKIKKL